MFLVVGLGNPGDEYRDSRHNAGFMAAARFRDSRGLGRSRSRYGGRWCEGSVRGREVAVLLPQTFMNNSGEAVAKAASRKHVEPFNIIVAHDDMDFPFGAVRLRQGGGSGGHKGLESVIAALGTDGFSRVRIGIGRPDDPVVDPSDWVLEPFDAIGGELEPVLECASEGIEAIIVSGVEVAMNRFNRRAEGEE